ncbi:hypothetical protein PUMCH_001179 [Australozyma saopauloensis]|uniref:Cullin family profile domain-containing protein n=1 Tax=Australozyma saopauloensis TaxID=291208 RepID=A0AAX4H619_9ASCO|nr:hypothetical protein PUMCH_001179 [[Candida] saopauloensis]
MAPNVVLSPALMKSIAPTQVLADLLTEPHDTENDLTFLLHWLQPYYLHPGEEYVAPLARIRAAAKQCLREPVVQLKFVDLLVNSIAVEFQLHLQQFVQENLLLSICQQINALTAYYNRQAAVLNLSKAAGDLFQRSLKALFIPYLLTPKVKQGLVHLLHTSVGDNAMESLQSFAAVGMAPFIQTVVVSVTTERIQNYVFTTFAGVWDQPCLASLQQWVRINVYPTFIAGVFDSFEIQSSSSNDLVQFAQDKLINLRTSEMYDMVVACNRSTIAFSEVHLCLATGSPTTRTLQRARLVDAFISQCNSKLLHLGSNTVKIIVEYINTIKALLIVDPTGVLLDKVARPIRKYLKTRRDLVSHLVKGMLDPNPETNRLYELASALRDNTCHASTAIDDLTDIHWVPDPIDALPDFKKGKVSDFVDALTSVLPLLAVLIDEFTKLFAVKLLEASDNLREIFEDVEKLKLRFGQSEFATLDVMIRDVEESSQLNQKIGNPLLNLTILSRNYWPSVSELSNENDTLNLPIQEELNQFSRSFGKLKQGRHLKYLPSMGQVVVELVFDNCSKEFNVTPSQATVVELFNEDDDPLSLLTIALSTGLSNYATSQTVEFWIKQGVLEDIGQQRYKAVSTYTG